MLLPSPKVVMAIQHWSGAFIVYRVGWAILDAAGACLLIRSFVRLSGCLHMGTDI